MAAVVLQEMQKDGLKEGIATSFSVGDTVNVHVKIREGEKERVQQFKGIVIARKGRGDTETFTVRRISHGVGVERVFPVHSPRIEKLEVVRAGRVKRAKLYYLRDRSAKQMRVKDARRD